MVDQPPPSHLTSRRQIKIWKKQQAENATKRQKVESYVNQNPFRYAERQFKARVIPKDVMSHVIDTNHFMNAKDRADLLERHATIKPIRLTQDLRHECPSLFGDEVTDEWMSRARDGYVLTDIPGLILIPNPFTPAAQRRLVQRCLTDYAYPPHTSNLDAHYDRPTKGVWDLYQRQQKGTLKEDDWLRKRDDDNDEAIPPDELLRKQRWVTLGYQYDWKTKVYDLEHGLSMPKELDALAKTVVSAVEGVGDGASWCNTYPGVSFKAEAGVINYYQLRDTLMAHVDKSEVNMDAPLVSVSFGHACIYLVGGPNKETAPIPLCLRSGDLLIMSGSSRLSYHGVPRILEDTLPVYLKSNQDDDDDDDGDDGDDGWKLFSDYMSTARINLNIRQVFPLE